LQALVAAVPVYQRGTIAYAAYEYGWLLSEIVQRVDGRSLSGFLRDDISHPLGLPALQFGLAGRKMDELAYQYWLGKEKVIVSGVNVAEGFEARNNSIEQINSLNPAVSMVSDAASLAAFYEFLLQGGVDHTGRRIISEATIRKYTSRNVSGIDRSSRLWSNLGRGFMVGSGFVSIYGWWGTKSCFGHAGGFSSLAFGDFETSIAAAIVTNGNRNFYDLAKRFIPLAHNLRKTSL
jgi:CubicO group peptidase (beta-lactamase class C family)